MATTVAPRPSLRERAQACRAAETARLADLADEGRLWIVVALMTPDAAFLRVTPTPRYVPDAGDREAFVADLYEDPEVDPCEVFAGATVLVEAKDRADAEDQARTKFFRNPRLLPNHAD